MYRVSEFLTNFMDLEWNNDLNNPNKNQKHLQMAEDGETRALENLSAAVIDPTPAECPQHKRRRGLPVADAVPAGLIP